MLKVVKLVKRRFSAQGYYKHINDGEKEIVK